MTGWRGDSPGGDSEESVIIVGGGLSGLATALGASRRGWRVTVLESADLLGGAAAYSGGQVWVGANHVAARDGIDDDLARSESYVLGIAHDRPELLDVAAMRRWLTAARQAMRQWEDVGAVRWQVIPGLADYHADVPGASADGRYLTGEPVPAARLGQWRDALRVSPYFRMGMTYTDLFEHGRRETASRPQSDEGALTFGTGLVAGFLAKVLEQDRVEILVSHRVTGLLARDGSVVGAQAHGPAGPVLRSGPVVLATSAYDWDAELVEEFLGLAPDDFGSMAPESLLGDGIRLARSAGGAVAAFPAGCVPLVPGWPAPGGQGFENGPEYAMPHAMIVDAAGHRFCDDSYWVSIVPAVTGKEHPHRPFFLVVDDQHRQRYGLGSTPPGGDYPDGLVSSAPTLREVGQALGIDGEQLEITAAEFSRHAEHGEDPRFGRGSVEFIRRFSGDPSHRPNPVLGPIRVPPFHGLRLRLLGTGIGSSGVRIDGDGRVLAEDGSVVPNLYAVGSCAAATTFGTGYNSGFALSRGLTLAYLVAGQL
ncbi:MAG: FAD-dependent oxidoreductase [Actinobacteria bacterium]|nr:FAD-dependent oxidoreductase [Actinomycetota bacterium]